MRERPILFSAPMVRAILEGRKTQTRRVVKMQPRGNYDIAHLGCGIPIIRNPDPKRLSLFCPYGQPGDRLWVKETYADLTATHGQPWERRNPDTGLYERGRKPFLWYRADGEQPEIGDGRSPVERWRPSTHMPRWASRIDLEVTGVRVERLQDISEKDCWAEGIISYDVGDRGPLYGTGHPDTDPCASKDLIGAYAELWESISGPGSWDANPWVWVVEFKRVKP